MKFDAFHSDSPGRSCAKPYASLILGSVVRLFQQSASTIVSQPYIKKLPAGGHHTVSTYYNLSGTLTVFIKTEDGSNVLPKCWWINGVGKVSHLGKKTDNFTTKIAFNKWFLSAKFRVATTQKTILYIYHKTAPGGIPLPRVSWDW